MIPDELIEKTKRAIHRATGQHLGHTWEETPQWYRVGVTEEARAALESVAADIWDQGYAAYYARRLQSDRWPYPDEDEQTEKEYAEACGRNAATRAPNPYRASETA